MVRSHFDTSEGSSTVNVRRLDGVGFLFELSLSGRRLLRRVRLIQKMLSDGELLIVLRRQIHFDRDQGAVTSTGILRSMDHLCTRACQSKQSLFPA